MIVCISVVYVYKYTISTLYVYMYECTYVCMADFPEMPS